MFAQRRNRLTTHFSERIPVVKDAYLYIQYWCRRTWCSVIKFVSQRTEPQLEDSIFKWPKCPLGAPLWGLRGPHLRPCLLTYILTSWSRVLLEKLTGSAASQEIPRIFRTRKFITVFTSARHLSLSWANSIQSPQPPPTSWSSILILSSHLRLGLPNGSFPQVSPPEPCAHLIYIHIYIYVFHRLHHCD